MGGKARASATRGSHQRSCLRKHEAQVAERTTQGHHLLDGFFTISGRRGMWLVLGAAKLCCSVNVTAAAALSTSCGSSSNPTASAAFLRDAAACAACVAARNRSFSARFAARSGCEATRMAAAACSCNCRAALLVTSSGASSESDPLASLYTGEGGGRFFVGKMPWLLSSSSSGPDGAFDTRGRPRAPLPAFLGATAALSLEPTDFF